MESLQILLYASLALTLYVVAKNFLGKLLNHPPSPFLNLPLIGHLYLVKKPLHRALARISDRYGPVVLLQLGSRRVLVVSSPAAAEECFTKNDVVFANRPHLLAGKHLGYNYTSLAWSSYGDHWRNLRKIASIEILSTHRLQSLHSIRVDEVRSTVRRLKRAAGEGGPVEMKTVFFELTMNVVMRMIAGKRYYGEKVEEAEEAGKFREIVTDTFRLGGSNTADFLPFLRLFGAGGVEKELVALRRKRDQFMQELVDGSKRRLLLESQQDSDMEGDKKTKTMIEMLLVLQQKEPDYYTDAMIKSLMLVLLAAGTDTSAGTMEWALTLLLNNPHVLEKAQAEIDRKIGHERLLDESDVSDLPYLRSIINETLRLFPAGPLLVPHESSEPCTVAGHRVPAGTMLLVNLWAMQKDPKYWEDADRFKPERFEGLDGARDGFRLMPFGSGRRSCPGEGLAVRVLGFGLGSIIQCFDWSRVGDDLVDVSEGLGLTLPKAKPLIAYCRARPVAAKLLSEV